MALLVYLLLRRLSGQRDGPAQIAFRVVVDKQAMVLASIYRELKCRPHRLGRGDLIAIAAGARSGIKSLS